MNKLTKYDWWSSMPRELYGLDFWAAFENTDSTPVATPYRTYSSHDMTVNQTTSELNVIDGNLEKRVSICLTFTMKIYNYSNLFHKQQNLLKQNQQK